MKHPIDAIKWLPVDDLRANTYNPNVVYTPELRLLERSILQQGWLQPILVNRELLIIDGFHRAGLAKTSAAVRALTAGKVPCAVLDISTAEAMLLTVRMNRAKGSHIAIKMHELVAELVTVHGQTPKHIAESIGATADEVELLLQDGVFKALKISEHKYSTAWVP